MATTASARAPKPKADMIEVTRLNLDADNPRLPERPRSRSSDDLVQVLVEDFSLSELGRSLAINGFFAEEPLAAVKRANGEYTVVEGNRRLAALKLLTDPKLRRRLGLDEWDEIAKLAGESGQDLGKVPVVVYDRRDQLLTFMGFRHITGVKPWEPLAKARFIHSLIDEHGMDYQAAARTVGSKPNAVKQQYFAYRVFLEARDTFEIDVERLERVYSTFYVAVRNHSISAFLGITDAKEASSNPKSLTHPLPKSKAANLEDLIVWIAGDKDHSPVIVDNSQLSALGEVLESPPAFEHFRVSRNLDAAKKLVPGEEGRLLDNLARASFHLDEAIRDAHRHKKSAKVEHAVKRCHESLVQIEKAIA